MDGVPSWKRLLDEINGVTRSSSQPPPKKRKFIPENYDYNATTSTNPNAYPNTGIGNENGNRNHATSGRESGGQYEAIANVIGQLDNGLGIIATSDTFSEETKNLVIELRKRLLREASTAYTKVLMQNDRHSAPEPAPEPAVSSYTDLPAPFPAIRVSNVNASGHTNSTTAASGRLTEGTLPPLPPITELTLMTAPFTHTSSLPTWMPPTSTNSYEPLEFLGDAYIELIATRLIHNRFPNHNVGQKSGLREMLVKNETLAQYSREYGLGSKIKVTISEREQAGKGWQKVLADVFEAYVACIILSDDQNGFKVAEDWLHRLWEPKVEDWRTRGEGKTSGVEEHVSMDVKSELQRFLVSKGVSLAYVEDRPMELDKSNNKTTFHMAVYLTGWGYNRVKLGSGSGRSKQLAGAEAAKEAFTKSKAILEDAHRKKLEFDRVHSKKRLLSLPAMGMRQA
jgi:ribonuclease-3